MTNRGGSGTFMACLMTALVVASCSDGGMEEDTSASGDSASASSRAPQSAAPPSDALVIEVDDGLSVSQGPVGRRLPRGGPR